MTIEEILAALQAIIDQAVTPEGEPRPMNEEEMRKYEDLETKLTAARKDVEIRARNQAYNTPTSGAPAGAIGRPRTGSKKEDTLERAFEAYLRTGQHNSDITELRAQGEGIGSAGGYMVPQGFRNKLTEVRKAFGGLAEVVESFTTSTGNSITWPAVDDTANEGEIVEEHGTFVGGADMTLTPLALTAYTYATCGASAEPLRISWELLQDAEFDVQGLVSRALGKRIARTQSKHIVSGTGVKQPQGIKTGLTGVQITANTGLTYNDLLHFVHSVDPEYRQSARWAFNDTSLETIGKIKDSNGDPLWRTLTATMGDDPYSGRLLGFPYTIDQGFPDINLSSGAVNWGVFGDLKEGYVVRHVRDVVLVVNPYSRASYRETEFSAYARMDAGQQNTAAYKALTGKA